MKPDQNIKYLALHNTWATKIWTQLDSGEDLEDYPAMTQTQLDYQQESYPIEYIPIVGLAINMMFTDEKLAISMLRHYGINEDIISQCQVLVFG